MSHELDYNLTRSWRMNRREFVHCLGAASAALGGAVLGVPVFAEEQAAPARPRTNIDDFLKTPRRRNSLPGRFPGRVAQVTDPRSLVEDKFDGAVIDAMFRRGLSALTGRDPAASFRMFFSADDVVGIKVNPVGPLINTRHEVVDAIVKWLHGNGVPLKNIVIWDRFDGMLKDVGFVPERFPGVRVQGLQTMVEEGGGWRDAKGRHVSERRFDKKVFYYAEGVFGRGVPGYKDDDFYLNQHVFNGEFSYFGKLLTKDLTKIINVPVFKNAGDGVSMATKNVGYGAVCNTGRLHRPLFFDVCTEVLAAPVIRDKLVLNVMDGLRGQYDGGPMPNEAFMWAHQTLYFATDPFAMDMIGQQQMVAKRKAEGVKVNEHPRYTEYLRYAEKLGLGVADPEEIELITAEA